jgi:hypothetical protein
MVAYCVAVAAVAAVAAAAAAVAVGVADGVAACLPGSRLELIRLELISTFSCSPVLQPSLLHISPRYHSPLQMHVLCVTDISTAVLAVLTLLDLDMGEDWV